MKKLRLIAAMLIILASCAKKESFVIFSTALVQGNIQAPEDCFKKNSCGGFPALKNIYDEERSPKMIVDLGNWSVDTLRGSLTKGTDVIAMMNEFPYAAAVPGITDINLPEKDFNRLLSDATFPVIGTNLYTRNGERKSGIENHKIIEINGHKIGVFSVLLANPKRPEVQKNYARFRVEKGSYDANLAINALKKEGAEIIIMLLSVNPEDSPGRDYYKEFTDIVKRANIIITDDSGEEKPFRIGNTWIIPAGTENKRVTRTSIVYSPEKGKIISVESRTIDIDPIKYKENPKLHSMAIKFQVDASKHFSKQVGTLKNILPLEKDGIPMLANYAADCIKAWAKTAVSIMPLSEAAAPISSTTVRLSDLYRSFPKESSIVFVKIRGENLEEALKNFQPDSFTASGMKLYYARNGKFENAELPTGSLKNDKLYQIAVPDSMITEKNAYILSNAAEFANSKHSVRETIRWCTASKYTFQPETQRIIKRTTK